MPHGPKPPLIVLTGPTAAGKTKLSLSLAKALQGEIISADSMQVYRGMDIGTAKISAGETEGIPHHLIDILSPEEEFNVTLFQERARACIKEIYERNHIPIVVGGTGFYIQALLYDIEFTREETDYSYRRQLEELAEKHGAAYLHEKLKEIDPASAEAIHQNNIKRVIRALEYYKETGEKISEHNEKQRKNNSPYAYKYYVLTTDREKLYTAIDHRVDKMLEDGLVEEVRNLYEQGFSRDLVSMQGLGYKELYRYFDGELTLDEAVYIIKRDTRHFAKRQLTWFRREREVTWINKDEFPDEEAILQWMLEDCKDIFPNNLHKEK